MSTLLLVDDDPVVLRIYQSRFATEGFAVTSAGDGETALRLIAAHQPDAVLLDLMLPGMSGLEVLRAVRAMEHLRRLPVVVFSNAYLDEEIHAAQAAGATRIIAKASNGPRQVVELVRAVLAEAAAPAPIPPPPGAPAPSPLPPRADAAVQLPVLPDRPAPRSVEPAPRSAETVRATSRRGALAVDLAPVLAQAERLLAGLAQDPGALAGLSRSFHAIGNGAVASESWAVAKLAAAGESLVRQLKDSPRYLSPSAVRTLGQAIARLRLLIAAELPPSDPAGLAALVVDDEAVARTTMCLALSKVGVRADPVTDAEAALAALAATRYDLVLSDVMMGRMNGFQFAARLRQLAGHARTPVIFVTAMADFDNYFRASGRSADDLIAKPFLLMELGTKALIHLFRGDDDPWQTA
jgi:CheY-like chemotaxis protein